MPFLRVLPYVSAMTLNLPDSPPHDPDHAASQPDGFEHRLRDRRFRLLAEWLQTRLPDPAAIDPVQMAARIAEEDDHDLFRAIADLATAHGIPANDVIKTFERCAVMARKQLTAERGEPTAQRPD